MLWGHLSNGNAAMDSLMGIGYAEIAVLTTGATILVTMAAFLRVKRPAPVLFITDIGRDIDDTLALFALEAYQRQGLANIVGVIATGGMGMERARLSRGWLRRLGLGDHIPVAACLKPGREVCDIESFDTPKEEDAHIYKKSAADLILELARIHKGKLLVFAVAPLTPLADAMETAEGLNIIRKGVVCLNIQGQATFENNVLKPDFQAFNLSENKEASETVFEKLQNYVPFRLLGKHAAYRVSLTRQDFMEWDQMILPQGSLIRTVKNGLQGLKESVASPNIRAPWAKPMCMPYATYIPRNFLQKKLVSFGPEFFFCIFLRCFCCLSVFACIHIHRSCNHLWTVAKCWRIRGFKCTRERSHAHSSMHILDLFLPARVFISTLDGT